MTFDQITNMIMAIIAIATALVTLITAGVKLFPVVKRLVKDANYQQVLNFINIAITEAEHLNKPGTDKLKYALNLVEQMCAEHNIPFNKQEVIDGIEAAIDLINTFNKRVK